MYFSIVFLTKILQGNLFLKMIALDLYPLLLMAHIITKILWHIRRYIFCQSDKK